MNEERPTQADTHQVEDPTVESRTSAAESHSESCRRCGQPVKGRRRNGYCSDRCRMAVARDQQRQRLHRYLLDIHQHLLALQEVAAALCEELGLEVRQ